MADVLGAVVRFIGADIKVGVTAEVERSGLPTAA
jgi:hypothetical protein